MQIDAATLTAWLTDGDEIAVLDAREQGVYFDSHLFHAACLPLSSLELDLERLVPRRSTRIVWCDDGIGQLAERAATRAADLGYTGCHVLDGGTGAWAGAGGELYSGVNVPSKAFGEFVEHSYGTPRIPASQLHGMLEDGTDLVILDSRPIEEFRNMSIPSAIDCPGAELVHRVKQVVADSDTLVVVNCAGRTRSIIGTQSLINAGLENRVVALENGTMGWELAGYAVDRGREVHAGDPEPDARRWSERAVRDVAGRFGVSETSCQQLARWQSDVSRTTYLFDVRTPQEFRDGHLPDSRNAPGGQLVQATDEYVATQNARLVLVDDNGVRATMTASWLQQLGWADAVVLAGGIAEHQLETGVPDRQLGPDVDVISAGELAEQIDATADGLAVLDLGSSLKYRKRGHVAGAWWGVRSRLDEAREAIGPVETLVLTSTDGRLAQVAVADAQQYWPGARVLALGGGTRGWRHAGLPMTDGFDRATTAANDVWYKPYDHPSGVAEQQMRAYLTWEVALVEQIARDPTVTFERYGEAQEP